MPILARNVTLPLFMSVEAGASLKLPTLFKRHGLSFNRLLLVTGGRPLLPLAEAVQDKLSAPSLFCRVSDSSEKEVTGLIKKIEQFKADAVVGVGGGMVLDTAKCAASLRAVSFISVPTAVSNDGIASPVAVIRTGTRTESRTVHMPVAVAADLTLIRRSPERATRSGLGDLLANLSACADWELSARRKKETLDDFTCAISRNAANRALETGSPNLKSTDFLKTLTEGLIMSGIAMGISGSSRPSSGAEHMISHAMDQLFDRPATHGEQCGVATLFTLALHRIPLSPIKRFYALLNLAKTPSDLGLTRSDFFRAVKAAPSMRPDRYSILNEAGARRLDAAWETAYVL